MPDTKERIVKAAYKLFSERGYGSVGMRDVSKAAGVNTMTLYRRFESKEKLFTVVLETTFHSDLERRITKSLTLPDDVEAIRRAYLAFMGHFDNNQLLRLVLFALLETPYLVKDFWIESKIIKTMEQFIYRFELGMKRGSFRKCNPVVAVRTLLSGAWGINISNALVLGGNYPHLVFSHSSHFDHWLQGVLPR